MESAKETDVTNCEKKSGAACSSCHRRKLKCDRMPVCSNCRKADIPCVYTSQPSKSGNASTTRDGRRKARGPYQKGRTVREKELEHVVELLQEKCTVLEAKVNSSDTTSPGSSYGSGIRSQGHGTGTTPVTNVNESYNPTLVSIHSPSTNDQTIHPPPAQILEFWLIYTTTVDPVTKILHVPTFTPLLLDAMKCHQPTMKGLLLETDSLLLSIYIAALNVLEPEQVQSRFSASKHSLMTTYSTHLDRLLLKASEFDSITFPTLQALTIYMGCLRRQSGPGDNIVALFNLAAQSARNLKLDDPASYLTLPPLDAELRRRTWWTICRHESAYAEEIQTRKQSLMHDTNIPLPGNFEDRDLDASMTATNMPAPRIGVTGMSFVLVMLEIVQLCGALSKLFVDTNFECKVGGHGHGASASAGAGWGVKSNCMKEQSRQLVEETRGRMDLRMLQYCSVSRPFDWFLMLVSKMLLTKVEVMLLSPSSSSASDSNPTAHNAFHDLKVSLSLDIIECQQILLNEPRLDPWRWLYRNNQQWYSMVYVVEEMARRPDAPWIERAWKVIDVVFADMELLNKHGMKPGDRTRLLEGHGRAIEARERILGLSGLGGLENQEQRYGKGVEGCVHGNELSKDYSLSRRPEPWQIDQSLFDVQEAQLATMEDPFFWPST